MKAKSVDELINFRYKNGLELKYEQLLKISKSISGINEPGWSSWLLQNGISNARINAKDISLIFRNTLKE
jgi:hypothetical protein